MGAESKNTFGIWQPRHQGRRVAHEAVVIHRERGAPSDNFAVLLLKDGLGLHDQAMVRDAIEFRKHKQIQVPDGPRNKPGQRRIEGVRP